MIILRYFFISTIYISDQNEFKYVKEAIEKEINNLLKNNFGKSMPFMIINSWINIMEKYGYQEFHHHNSVCDPILLASSLRKNLPVLTICSTVTWFPHPLGQQVPCMAG